MIIKNKSDLSTMYNLIVDINKKITVDNHQILNPDHIYSALSSSSYIDNLEDDIINIVYGILMNHPFSDGNKRTGLVLLVILSEEYKLNLIKSDIMIYKDIIDLVTHKIDKDQFKKLIYK
jgi:prophage maintenance system killer protein